MKCQATLTTATVTKCPNYGRVTDVGWCLLHLGHHRELHTLTCVSPHPHGPMHRAEGDTIQTGVVWSDDTKGATPHTPTPTSTVTDAEWEAASEAFRWHEKRGGGSLLAALEAAAAARAAQGDDR